MSFILDALKKSESDRQRQSGPALYEVKVAAPRSQLPYWAIGLIVLLGINLVIVAWALLRRPARAPEAPVAAASAPVPAAAPMTMPPAITTSPPQSYPPPGAAYPGGAQASVQAAAAGPAGDYPAPGVASQGTGGQPPVPAPGARPADEGRLQGQADGAARSADTQGGPRTAQEGAGEQGGNPDDYAPATEPRQSPGLGFHVRRGTEEGVPLYSQVATASGSTLPELRLDMWAYDQKPENRFVLINMKRLREGDSLPDGVRVEAITPDGAVLSHNGTRFLLPRE
jgi:general secretion pathway protein B